MIRPEPRLAGSLRLEEVSDGCSRECSHSRVPIFASNLILAAQVPPDHANFSSFVSRAVRIAIVPAMQTMRTSGCDRSSAAYDRH